MLKRLLGTLLVCLLLGCADGGNGGLDRIVEKRPAGDKAIFDYVGLMADVDESTNRYLDAIRGRYGVETLIVALPSLENRYTVNEAAAAIFSNWEIGAKHGGRGILLLLVDDVKRVKLEVGYELEDVFTDAFTGYIQDSHLQPRYTADQLDVGFIAVMEALESRAQVKFRGDYTHESIASLDADYLSQGAGAGRNLDTYARGLAHRQTAFTGRVNTAYPAGQTPQEAWQTLLRRWKDRVTDPFLGVYTPVTRLTFRDFTNMPASRLEKEYATYAAKSYEVLQEGDYAVIYFGRKTGWDNSPFLLCRTDEGWQFDIVHQRRFIRMGQAPHWGVEFSEHPHMKLLLSAFHFRGQDIPVDARDAYSVDRDAEMANRILDYEERVKKEPGNAEALLELGRLYTITSMNQKGIPLLQQALKLDPGNPLPLKYLAIAQVDAYYQYDKAKAHLAAYIRKAPDDPLAHNFSGYLFYRNKDYQAAARAFESAVSLDPDNGYAHFYLAYTYAWLYADALAIDPRRPTYRKHFNHHTQMTRSLEAAHPIRVLWLNRWLEK